MRHGRRVVQRVARQAPVLVALCTGIVARAEPSPEEKATATALFKEAKALFEQGNVESACEKFAESQRLDPGGGTLLNLALCHETQGLLATAWAEFTEASAIANRDGRSDRLAFAREHIEAIEPRLSHIIISVPETSRIPGLVVRRNGAVVGAAGWGTEIPADGGTHLIEAEAPGHDTWRIQVTIDAERDRKTVEVPRLSAAAAVPVLPPAASNTHASARPPVPTQDRNNGLQPPAGAAPGSVLPWVLGGFGIASLAVGGYEGYRAFDLKKQSDDACDGGSCGQRAVDLNHDAGRAADVSTVACAVGVAALGVSTYLLLTEDDTPIAVSVGAGTLHWGVFF